MFSMNNAIIFNNVLVWDKPFAHVSKSDNWNNSMAQYDPTITVYFFDKDAQLQSKTIGLSSYGTVYENEKDRTLMISPPDALQAKLWANYVELNNLKKQLYDASLLVNQINKGDLVKVFKGRKFPIGTIGKVFWLGESGYGMSAGLKTLDNKTIFVSIHNLESISINSLTSLQKVSFKGIK